MAWQTYAHITGGVVDHVVTLSPTDTTYPKAELVRIDTVSPQPSVGWTYNGTTFAFGQTPEQVQAATGTTITDYIVQRRARLTAIRAQAQTVAGRTASAAGTLTTAQLSNAVRALEVDMKTLANAVDDLAQYDIRVGRRLLNQFDGTD